SGQLATDTYPVRWLDPSGATTPLLAKPDVYAYPRLSRDGHRLALQSSVDNRPGVVVYDLERDQLARLNTRTPSATLPVWAPDGKHLVFTAARAPTSAPGGYSLIWVPADGGVEIKLRDSENLIGGVSFSPDGQRLAYFEHHPETGVDLWILPLDL